LTVDANGQPCEDETRCPSPTNAATAAQRLPRIHEFTFRYSTGYCTGKKTPVKRHRGEPGHTRDTGQTRDTRTAEPHNHPNPPTHPRDRETTESAADSTAAAPEPTAPRGRLRRGRPLRTRPSRLPLPSAVMALATVRRNCVSTPRRGSCGVNEGVPPG
jgi:hypothetical protein